MYKADLTLNTKNNKIIIGLISVFNFKFKSAVKKFQFKFKTILFKKQDLFSKKQNIFIFKFSKVGTIIDSKRFTK